jgi:hypothetical protein
VIEPSPQVAAPTEQSDVRKTQRPKRERGLLARIFGIGEKKDKRAETGIYD